MNSSFLKSVMIIFILIMVSGNIHLTAQESVTFQVDLTDVDMEPGTVVGLRGDMAPLTWDKSLPMSDPEGDSIYSVKVIFNEGSPGDRIMYKYMVGETWDNDRFGPYGNRVVALCNCPQVLPVDTWDRIESFVYEFLLEDAVNSEIYAWIFIIGQGKQRGLTAEEAAREYFDFWEGNNAWLERPETLMIMEEFEQAKYYNGYFERVENEPGKVVYKMRKNWANYITIMGDDNEWMGVTADEIMAPARVWLEDIASEKGWDFSWEDEGMNAIVTLEVK